MKYPTLSLWSAKKAYSMLAASEEPDWNTLEVMRGVGEEFCQASVLESEAEAICNALSFPLSTENHRLLEGQIGIMLHENLGSSEPTGDADFWRWVALRPLRMATLKRHQVNYADMPHRANFGIGALADNFAYRAWMRAEIAFDPSESGYDKYRLAFRGDQDLWRSHLIRVRYSFNRAMAHALIEFQYPTEDSKGTLKKGDKDDGIRMLAKKLQRYSANLAFALMCKDECHCLIKQLANGLTMVDGTKFLNTGRE